MRISAPIYRLRRKAKLLSRDARIPLHQALNRIAVLEGYASWSLLAARASAASPASKLFPRLSEGDLVLLGARPGHGKTLLSLELAAEAMKSGNRAIFFTLEYSEEDVRAHMHAANADKLNFVDLFKFDDSDDINADYIVRKLECAPRGTLVIIDYLQLLDQKRQNPELMQQVRTLQSFARAKGLIFVFISQIGRSYDPRAKAFPDLEDVRLPNPLDLRLFSKTCFLNDGEVQFRATG